MALEHIYLKLHWVDWAKIPFVHFLSKRSLWFQLLGGELLWEKVICMGTKCSNLTTQHNTTHLGTQHFCRTTGFSWVKWQWLPSWMIKVRVDMSLNEWHQQYLPYPCCKLCGVVSRSALSLTGHPPEGFHTPRSNCGYKRNPQPLGCMHWCYLRMQHVVGHCKSWCLEWTGWKKPTGLCLASQYNQYVYINPPLWLGVALRCAKYVPKSASHSPVCKNSEGIWRHIALQYKHPNHELSIVTIARFELAALSLQYHQHHGERWKFIGSVLG